MAESLNARIADRLTEHHLRDARVETALRLQVWAQLDRLEADILALLKQSDPTQFVLLSRRRREVELLMQEEVDPLIRDRYGRIATLLDAALFRLAEQEAEAVQQIVNEETNDADTIAVLPTTGQLRRAVEQTPIPTPQTPTDIALPGAEWWTRQGANLSDRLKGQLLVAVALEASLTQATQRIRGTVEQGLQDGIMARVKDDAARLIRTQVTNAVGEARALVAARNAPGLMLQHSSVLDSRTSTICLARHGLRYEPVTYEPLGHSIPYLTGVPYHPH